MLTSRLFTRTMPIALGGALVATALSAGSASASSGPWRSTGGGGQGFYNSVNGQVSACDIKTDGYKAVVQIFANDGRLLTTTTDGYNNDSCSWKTPVLFEGTHKIKVCVQKGNARPVKCSSAHAFYAT
ncbi:hypothetical protein [Streptomyces sp. NPDC050546]|uniref:hypothetical protein n=1 Tax=Streptomyces sp. NPDC050546 TaxID=3365628 RepID=UPI0037A2ED73